MKAVISVGGSVLAAPGDHDRIAAYGDAVSELVSTDCTLGVVVGGGVVAREYIAAGRSLGANEIELDAIGIEVTRLNARLLIAATGADVAPTPAETYTEARSHLATYDACVMGGTEPGHTTDAVSAALAEFIDAEVLVLATSVPGVFDADPNTDPDATHLPDLTAAELVDVIASLEMNAGSPAPVDLLAAKLIQRSGMRVVVLDGTDPAAVVDAVTDGVHDGTDIVPDGNRGVPSLWPDA